jgi:transposase
LSFVPDPEQRAWRTLRRMKTRRARHPVRRYSQGEDLREEMRIKLSCVLSDRFGASGLRILRALAQGETDPKKLAARGDDRLKEQLVEALTGNVQAMQREWLKLYLEQLRWIDEPIEKLSGKIAEALKPHEEAVARRAEVPGFGPDSAPPVMAEVGVRARTFPSAGNSSGVGTCPGQNPSAEENHSRRSSQGNRSRRPVLAEAAPAAVQAKGSRWSSGVCCPAGAIRERLGRWPTGCAAGRGRFRYGG